jgi:hypothetical protein
MITANQSNSRKRKSIKFPYYRVQYDLPLGETPAVRACLQSNGLWEIVADGLREVYYYRVDARQNRRDFCAVGWPNENGGWELRHAHYTGCLGPKGMTYMAGQADMLLIVVNFTDYLCWKHQHQNDQPSVLVLNHPQFLSAAIKRAAQFADVKVAFDRLPENLFTHGICAVTSPA